MSHFAKSCQQRIFWAGDIAQVRPGYFSSRSFIFGLPFCLHEAVSVNLTVITIRATTGSRPGTKKPVPEVSVSNLSMKILKLRTEFPQMKAAEPYPAWVQSACQKDRDLHTDNRPDLSRFERTWKSASKPDRSKEQGDLAPLHAPTTPFNEQTVHQT